MISIRAPAARSSSAMDANDAKDEAADEVDNPLEPDEKQEQAAKDELEDVIAAIQEKSMPPAEAARALRKAIAAGAPPERGALGALAGRLSEAPTNMHQVTVFLLTTKDAVAAAEYPAYWAPGMLLLGVAVVLVQTLAMVSVLRGTSNVSCLTSDQCGGGSYCFADLKRCIPCGSDASPLATQTNATSGATFNNYWDKRFAGYNSSEALRVCSSPETAQFYIIDLETPPYLRSELAGVGEEAARSWCDACVSMPTGDVNGQTVISQAVNAAVDASVFS